MNGPVHRFIGIFTAVSVAVGMSDNGTVLSSNLFGHDIFPILGAMTAGVAATLPDFDMKISPKIHRGPTHSLVAIGLIGLFYFTLSNSLSANIFSSILLSLIFGIFVGYASHIWADLHNGAGEAILWPLPHKFHVMRISTGTWQEYAWAGAVCLIALCKIIGWG